MTRCEGTLNRKKWLQLGLAFGILALALGTASAEDDVLVVIKDHRFSPSDVKVKSNTKIKLVIRNEDVSAEEFESFSLNRERVIQAGRSITIYLPPLKPGSYEFFGDFHPDTAKGKVIAE
jgi:plastocyanin